VYYEDTDCGGMVYYANYLRYMERGRTELLREHGVELADFHAKGVMFAVVDTHVRYRASARYADLLTVETQITEKTSVSLTFDTKIYNQAGKLLTTSETKLACITKGGKACRVPEELAAALDL
jgi:acyl-CoA thioester hydrolase